MHPAPRLRSMSASPPPPETGTAMPFDRRIPRVLTGAALIAALGLLFAVATLQALGWYRFVPVLSGSMAPSIETGDLAILQPVAAVDLAVGDVIAFEAPTGDQRLMLHRVSEIVSPAPALRIRTQGDANPVDDPWTASVTDDVLWRSTGRIASIGQPVVFAHRVGAPTISLMGGALILFGLVMRRLWVLEPDRFDDEPGPPPGADPDARGATGPAQPAESIVALLVVAAVVVAGVGLILARPARATFTADATEEQRVTYRSVDAEQLPPPTDLTAKVICDLTGAPTGVQLAWTQPVRPVDFIVVERSSTPLLGIPEPFTELARVRGTLEQFTDDFATVDPPPSNPLDVRYRVRAGSSDGRLSAYSNVAPVEPCVPVRAVPIG